MKGLLLKDFYMAVKYCKAVLLVIAVFIVATYFGEQISFFVLFYPTIICSILPVTLISYDDRDKWHQYSGTLPYSKAQLVTVKYLSGLFLGGVPYLLSLGAVAIRMGRNGAFSLDAFFSIAMVVFLFGWFCPTFLLPLVFKWGVEKARVAFYVMVGLVCGISAVLAKNLFSGDVMQPLLPVLPMDRSWLLLVLLSGALLLSVLSWRLSIQLYSRREL